MSSALISIRKVCKVYGEGPSALNILKNIDLDIYHGDAVCVAGASGAGKSTLLHIMGTLDKPTSGQVFFEGNDLFAKSDSELARFRNQTMGFVFQFHHLLSEFTALENVSLPAQISGLKASEAKRRAKELLSLMGMTQRSSHYPSELSGGEQQRVAIARALIMRPKILFADEPTGNLDMANGKLIQDLFFSLQDRFQLTLVVVTHDAAFASRFTRRLHIKDGAWT
jgi:lipoprotein-releasing system ATP-binding protein